MHFLFVVTCVVAALCQFVFASATWPNEPANSTLLNDWGHDAIVGGGWSDVYSGYNVSITSDPTAPISPPNVLQQRFAAGLVGGNGGGGGTSLKLPTSCPDIFWGFSFKLDANYEQNPNGTKLGWIHTDNASDGTVDRNQLFLLMQGPQGGPYSIRMDYQGGLDPRLFFNPSSGSFQPGQWVKVEIYWKPSSCNTCHDGIWRWWVNGELAGNVTDMITDRLRASRISHQTIWGGTGSVKTRDSFIWFDHEHISAPNLDTMVIGYAVVQPAKTNLPYSFPFAVFGGEAPYSWSVSTGSLPKGMTLNTSTGVLSGTPTINGRYDFTVQVSDAGSPARVARKSLNFFVNGTSIAAQSQRIRADNLRIEPSAGSVHFGLPEANEYQLGVYDLSGREVWRHKGNGEVIWNHGGKLRKGVYLVRGVQNGKVFKMNFCEVR